MYRQTRQDFLSQADLKPRLPLLGSVKRVSDISTDNNDNPQNKLDKEPSPSTALRNMSVIIIREDILALLLNGTFLPGRSIRGSWAGVQVPSRDSDDVVIIGEFAGLCGETEVTDGGEGDVFDVEAFGPGVRLLVLEFEGEEFVLEVGYFGFCGLVWGADATGLRGVVSKMSWMYRDQDGVIQSNRPTPAPSRRYRDRTRYFHLQAWP